jgi:hypothetical protein
MKKIFYLFLVILLGSIGFKILDNKIKNNVANMSVFKLPQHIEDNLTYFFAAHGFFPINLDLANFHDIASLSVEELKTLQKKTIIDPYSKSSQKLYYIKIEDNGGRSCGYILLSAGIDGYINNQIKAIDCDRNMKKELFLYDSEEFSFFDYFFGQKDLIYSYENKCDCDIKQDSNLYIIPIRWLDY